MKKSIKPILLLIIAVLCLGAGAYCVVSYIREAPTPIKTERVGRKVTKTYASVEAKNAASTLQIVLFGGLSLVVIGFMAGAKGLKLAGNQSRERKIAPFLGNLPDYLNPAGLTDERGDPSVTGRIVSVDKSNGTMHEFFLALPPELRAFTPEQVGTVLWIEETKEVTGMYPGDLPALRRIWTVSIIDLKARLLVGQIRAIGDDAPAKVSREHLKNEESRTGKPPTKATKDYLLKLPRL